MAKEIKGIAASEGIGIAPAYRLVAPDLHYTKRRIENPMVEYKRFMQAVDASLADLRRLKERAAGRLAPDALGIFDAHAAILSDPELLKQVKQQLDQQVCAEEAVDTVTARFAQTLAQLTDPYLQERAGDVRDVAKRLLSHLLGRRLPDIGAISQPVVLVAHEVTPSDTSQMDTRFIRGIVTDLGGRTSHAAIMARTLGIPAVVGTDHVTRATRDGQLVVVDGLQGTVVVEPSAVQVDRFTARAQELAQERTEWRQQVNAPSVSKDGQQFEISANIGNPNDVAAAVQQGADGVGLFRSEFLYMGSDHLPTEDEQYQAYRQALVGMHGRPVVVRTLDIGGDKPLPYLPLPREMNPFLGYRAIRICLKHPEIFKTQLRALIRASAHGPLAIMFPMIGTIAELRAAKEIFNECRADLQTVQPGLGDDIKLGMMIEVPLAAINADRFAQEVDFFSIGTNDLIQYNFAADRGNDEVAYLYQPLNPAFLGLVKHVIDAGHRHDTKVAMCGEMAGDSTALPLLLGMGLDEYSMSASSILRTRTLMSKLDTNECAQLADEAINRCVTHEEVRALVEDRLGAIN
ncbi:phosphoenolpyruvate--protein phosphotransferase [Limosilactobacillus antri]|uniref:phosphoenolpyruvate--protein phosphotransferase n=1 Tax=Limosilactobacillus antri TaxID=227943 RepID=UPI001F57D973|nr:phosphoenolpyruvate--protein phosphotransferase [Limosilactobacillus antri]